MTSETAAQIEVAEGLSAPARDKARAAVTPDWLTAGRFSLLLLLLIMAAFPEVIFGAKTFLFRDYSLFGYPLAHYHREAFWRGEVPLWNPLNNSGIPFLAQWNTMVFYPLSLVYLLLPMPWSLGWFCLFHLFLAGLGMHCLAFRWTENRLAASLAGIAFAFSGLTLSCLIWPNNIAALGWMPWVCLFVERGCNGGRNDMMKAIFAAAIQMLSGAPEIIFFTWIIVGAIWTSQFCAGRGHRSRLFGRFLLIISVVAALCAVQLLPFLDLLQHSYRVGEAGSSYWSMPPWGWANFLVPLFRTTPVSMGVFLQPGQGWISSYYPGIGVLLLALLAIWKARGPLIRVLALVLGLSVILALGDAGHVYRWMHELFPEAGLMRFPIKWIVLAGAAIPLLGAFGLSRWRASENDKKREFGIGAIVIAGSFLLLIACIVRLSAKFPGVGEQPHVTLVNGITRAAALILFLSVLFACQRRLGGPWHFVAQAGLLLALSLDLIFHAPNQNPTVDARAYEINLPSFAEMQPRPIVGQSRALLSLQTLERFHSTAPSNRFEAILGSRLGLSHNCNLLEEVPKIDGFYSLYLPEEQQIRFNLFPSTNSVRPGLADFLGVSQISSDSKFLDWEKRPGWMPMITSGQQPKFSAPAETLQALCDPGFDPRQLVYLPLAAKSVVNVSNSIPAKIITQDVSAHRIRAQTEGPQSSMLLFAQAYYHPWKATIDGKPTTLWRANYAFQAIEIPGGHHQVELVYEDQGFRWGAMISGGTLLGCLGFVFPRKRFR